MIYLYAGLGIAMLLPIMAGLQMAISVSQLEQSDFHLSDAGGVTKRWEDKEKELEEQLLNMPAMPPGLDATCPGPPDGFKVSNDCTFMEENDERHYVVRIYQSDKGWSACFVSKDHPNPRCQDEVPR